MLRHDLKAQRYGETVAFEQLKGIVMQIFWY